MHITKWGHCCLEIEYNSVRLFTDPGSYSEGFEGVSDIDAVIITHEHSDHLHIPSLTKVLESNPNAILITNSSVSSIVEKELPNTDIHIVEYGQETKIKDVVIKGYGNEHELILPSVPNVQNTGYLIAEKLFYPGDAFYKPKFIVPVLALPVVGPWVKGMVQVIEYLESVRPEATFPVHDGMLKHFGPFHSHLAREAERLEVSFFVPEHGRAIDIDQHIS